MYMTQYTSTVLRNRTLGKENKRGKNYDPSNPATPLSEEVWSSIIYLPWVRVGTLANTS